MKKIVTMILEEDFAEYEDDCEPRFTVLIPTVKDFKKWKEDGHTDAETRDELIQRYDELCLELNWNCYSLIEVTVSEYDNYVAQFREEIEEEFQAKNTKLSDSHSQGKIRAYVASLISRVEAYTVCRIVNLI